MDDRLQLRNRRPTPRLLPVNLPKNHKIIQSQRLKPLSQSKRPETIGTQPEPKTPHYEVQHHMYPPIGIETMETTLFNVYEPEKQMLNIYTLDLNESHQTTIP